MFVIKHTLLFIRCRLIRLVSYNQSMYVFDPCRPTNNEGTRANALAPHMPLGCLNSLIGLLGEIM